MRHRKLHLFYQNAEGGKKATPSLEIRRGKKCFEEIRT